MPNAWYKTETYITWLIEIYHMNTKAVGIDNILTCGPRTTKYQESRSVGVNRAPNRIAVVSDL